MCDNDHFYYSGKREDLIFYVQKWRNGSASTKDSRKWKKLIIIKWCPALEQFDLTCPTDLGLLLRRAAILSRIKSGLEFFKYSKIWALILKIAIKRARVQRTCACAQKSTHAQKSAKNSVPKSAKKSGPKSTKKSRLVLDPICALKSALKWGKILALILVSGHPEKSAKN